MSLEGKERPEEPPHREAVKGMGKKAPKGELWLPDRREGNGKETLVERLQHQPKTWADGSRLPNKLKSALKQVIGNQQEHSTGHQGNISISEGLSMPTDHSQNAGSAEAEAKGN